MELTGQLQSFSHTIADVERNNKRARESYKQAKADHKEKQKARQEEQRKKNWQKAKNLAKKINSPENIPKFRGKQYKTWKEYWKAKREYDLMNSK